MLTKNLSPFQFGAVASCAPPRGARMVLVARGVFRLAPGAEMKALERLELAGPLGGPDDEQPYRASLAGELFRPGDDDREGAAIYPGDFVDFKPRGEIMVKATCHVPGGRAATECPVRIRIGDLSKALRVLGPRRIARDLGGAKVSAPVPFKTMPITWENAFGGPGFDANPAGRGMQGDVAPTVETADGHMSDGGDRPRPGSFGPISSMWRARRALVGTQYGDHWQKHVAPHYAEDFDPAYFQSAPADQRIAGHFRGDEEVSFTNLHPADPTFTTTLPGLCARAFVKGKDGSFREVKMVLDTVFADLDDERLYLTWRGISPVTQGDFSDVSAVLVASERLGEAKPADDYRAALEAFERDPLELEGKLPSDEMAKGEPTANDNDAVSRYLAENGIGEEHRVPVREAMAKVKEAKPDIDLEAAVERSKKTSPSTFSPLKPGVMPPTRLKATMRALLDGVAKARAEIEKARPILEREGKAIDTSQLDAAEQVPHDPRLSQLDPSYAYPEPLSDDEPGPGADLRERDLQGKSLAGMDLSGANLEAADLRDADLSGANLAGASLKFAVLSGARLDGANLAGANLELANMMRVSAERATFTKANIANATFEGASLVGAVFDKANATYVIFEKANVEGASFGRADVSSSDFDSARAQGVKLAGAVAKKTLFARADLRGADFSGADLEGASFMDARCGAAVFSSATAERGLFIRAELGACRFDRAVLTSAFFDEANLEGASLRCVRARKARFLKAHMPKATFYGADLLGADFRNAALDDVIFRGASLYEVTLLGASGRGMDFDGANTTRMTRAS